MLPVASISTRISVDIPSKCFFHSSSVKGIHSPQSILRTLPAIVDGFVQFGRNNKVRGHSFHSLIYGQTAHHQKNTSLKITLYRRYLTCRRNWLSPGNPFQLLYCEAPFFSVSGRFTSKPRATRYTSKPLNKCQRKWVPTGVYAQVVWSMARKNSDNKNTPLAHKTKVG